MADQGEITTRTCGDCAATDEATAEQVAVNCYFCHLPIDGRGAAEHHPDRENWPDFTVPCHQECHHAHHTKNGDFATWGALSGGAGRKGYRAVLQVQPAFHRLGGRARAERAARDAAGRFLPGRSRP